VLKHHSLADLSHCTGWAVRYSLQQAQPKFFQSRIKIMRTLENAHGLINAYTQQQAIWRVAGLITHTAHLKQLAPPVVI
jgi:hypothetical protein